ncbi:hypothetical protein F4810DRAFT_542639 [Camillea tinctor]|nr:hypothetical protein F4810DRAFT_542639 [Camillea tinctor]
MTSAPLSPKRRHILSSINPEERSTSPKTENDDAIPEAPAVEPVEADQATVDKKDKKTTKFRFKSHSSRSHRSSRRRDRDRDDEREPHDRDDPNPEPSSHRRHRHRHHHRRHKRQRTRSPTPPNPYDPPPLSADAAFRESLFDAMADDEGATYWEGVYGQPIHCYGRPSPSSAAPGEGAGGELERMDDDEYAAYVRQRMWEKTHQGLLEERARREARRRERDEKEQEAARLTREMERSLRRGEERRSRRARKGRWETYLGAWAAWDGAVGGMAWPVESGRRGDVADAAAVREFFVTGMDPAEVGEAEFLARLKDERVRWHPDKIQQRLGGGGAVDEAVMRDVTAVFQIVDKLWSDTRAKAKKETT